jgi:hypothetical protein
MPMTITTNQIRPGYGTAAQHPDLPKTSCPDDSERLQCAERRLDADQVTVENRATSAAAPAILSLPAAPSLTSETPSRARVKLVPFEQANFPRKEQTGATSLTESLVSRPMLFRRNAVAWLSTCSWRAETRMHDLAAFRQAKRECDSGVIGRVGESLVSLICQVRGTHCADAVTAVPCRHSRRHDCFGKQVAQAVAKNLKLPFVEVFADRFCSGSSHPKEYRKLPPLEQVSPAPGSLLLVDDLATSGWHIEEALTALRALGSAASAFTWISSTVSRQ